MAVRHPEPEKVRLAEELRKRYPPDPGASRGVLRVLRTGESEFYPEIAALLTAVSRDRNTSSSSAVLACVPPSLFL